MLLQQLTTLVNNNLAGENLSYARMKPFLDNVIDDINEDLGAIYPAFSELDTSAEAYTAFPDKWLRSVVSFGAAWYFFLVDEEGISTAETLQQLYFTNLFKMQRDMIDSVPEQYQKGYVDPATLEEVEEVPEPDHYGTISAEQEGVTISGSTWRV